MSPNAPPVDPGAPPGGRTTAQLCADRPTPRRQGSQARLGRRTKDDDVVQRRRGHVPPVRKTSKRRRRFRTATVSKPATSKRNATPSFSRWQADGLETPRKGILPAAARRGSVGDRHAHAHVANGHGGASTSTARGGFVPPYVRKAFAGPAGPRPPDEESADRRGSRDGVGVSDPGEPPFSEQVMRRLSPRGEPIRTSCFGWTGTSWSGWCRRFWRLPRRSVGRHRRS